MASAIGHPSPSSDEPITALVEGTRCLAEEMDRFVMMFNHYCAHLEKSEHELQAAVWCVATGGSNRVPGKAHHKEDVGSDQPCAFNNPIHRIIRCHCNTHCPASAHDGYGCANKRHTFTKIVQA